MGLCAWRLDDVNIKEGAAIAEIDRDPVVFIALDDTLGVGMTQPGLVEVLQTTAMTRRWSNG